MSFLGIDLGTTFIKGAVLDVDNLRLSHITRAPFPQALPNLPARHYEIDPQSVVDRIRNLIAELLPHAPHCAGIVFSTQMHSLVLATAAGQPRSNALTWLDERILEPHPVAKGSYFELLAQRLGAEKRQQLGNELRPGLPICALFWLAQQGLLSPGLVPMTLPDFAIAQLCSSQPGIELTSASAHGLLNMRTLTWDEEAIARLGLGALHWPQIRPHGDVAGILHLGSQQIPCYNAVGDQQCALLGTGLAEGELSLNIATGSQVSQIRQVASFGNYQTRPFFDGWFLHTVVTIPAGRSLNALIGLLSELAEAQGVTLQDPWPYITQAMNALPESDLQVNLAFFASVMGNRGAMTNAHEQNLSVGHLFRAALQNMTDNYYTCALRLSPEQAWQTLVFSGGLAQKLDLLRTLIYQKFQAQNPTVKLQTRLSISSEDTLLGLLALARVYSGRTQSMRDAAALVNKLSS